MLSSYNGYPASEDRGAIDVVPLTVAGVPFPNGVKAGDVYTVLEYVARRFHTEVEPLGEGCWGYAYRMNRNADNLTCHASGTAIDLNAPKHPNGQAGTFTPAQVQAIQRILADCLGVVRWGGDFTGTKDEQHFEINATPDRVRVAAQHITEPAPPPTPPSNPEDDMPVIAITETHKHWLTDLFTGKAPISNADEATLLKAGVRKVGVTDSFMATLKVRS